MAALLGLVAIGCAAGNEATSDAGAPPPETSVAALAIDTSAAAAEVDSRFLSFAIDSSQVVGGNWWGPAGGDSQARVPPFDFARPRLRALASALAPAILRIGGTEADVVWYDLSGAPDPAAPAGYDFVLTRALWDGAADFARDLGLDLFVTVNGGPGPRDADGRWTPDNARTLIEHAVGRGDPVVVWELGNEINAYALAHGLRWLLSGAEYARDLAVLKTLVAEVDPGTPVAGPSSAFWPRLGEFLPITEGLLEADPTAADIVTWHYYPSQSRRCPIATRRSSPTILLLPPYLDEFDLWAEYVQGLRDRYTPATPIWLGETGNAQCGGEPGVSDRYVGGLWWLDELGKAARAGQPIVVRQTLAGSEYGLIDDATLAPRPDYWNSVLWKRLMGTRVLGVARTGDPYVRGYAHCAPGGGVTVLAINLERTREADVALEGFAGERATIFALSGDDLTSPDVRLNGTVLTADADGGLPPLDPRIDPAFESLPLPPASYAFVRFPDVDVPACR